MTELVCHELRGSGQCFTTATTSFTHGQVQTGCSHEWEELGNLMSSQRWDRGRTALSECWCRVIYLYGDGGEGMRGGGCGGAGVWEALNGKVTELFKKYIQRCLVLACEPSLYLHSHGIFMHKTRRPRRNKMRQTMTNCCEMGNGATEKNTDGWYFMYTPCSCFMCMITRQEMKAKS